MSYKILEEVVGKFSKVGEFFVQIPETYNHYTFIDEVAREKAGKIWGYDKQLVSANYPEATHRLVPGKKYRVEKFLIKDVLISIDEYLAFMREHGAYLTGIHGLFACEQYVICNDKNKHYTLVDVFSTTSTFCFDEKKFMNITNDGEKIPCMWRYSGGEVAPPLNYYLIRVKELKKEGLFPQTDIDQAFLCFHDE